jgi:hypothetical protein
MGRTGGLDLVFCLAVYNNFPWPMEATELQREKVEEGAGEVFAMREGFSGSTLADLYDPVEKVPVMNHA